jgi:hypothetical protein
MHLSIAIVFVIVFVISESNILLSFARETSKLTSSTKLTFTTTTTTTKATNTMVARNSRQREPVGDFYVHLIRGTSKDSIDRELTPSNALLKRRGKPTVISFYDGG